MGKHVYKRTKTPREWRRRLIKNRWHVFVKPRWKAKASTLLAKVVSNTKNYINGKIRFF